jgi:predicted unusual protein kinase regulating ubiquinone biosynthesis (AarF/ABC1/UbiB family)
MGYIFANGLLQLGPLYIKLGQILSCREDVLPSEWKVAMERLQDQVPALSGIRAQQLAYTIWPHGSKSFDDTFINVNWTPIAAASLGQVHTATLRRRHNNSTTTTPERVALKLQRPKLRNIYDNDLHLLKSIAATVDRFFGSTAGSVGGVSQSWTTIFNDAEAILYREIDYRKEGQNAIRFANDFGLTKGGLPATTTTSSLSKIATSRDGQPLPSAAAWLRTPYVYESLSTEQVLVMEYVPSIKISAIDQLTQANVTLADREYLADCLARSYLRQFCCNKFCTLP